MDVQAIKSQKRLILHPIDNDEPPNKKIRYEPIETSQVVFNSELKSRKTKRSPIDETIELQNNQNFDNVQMKVQKTNHNMNPHKKTSNGLFDNTEILNPKKRKVDDSFDNFHTQEKCVKTNNNSDIELAQKLPNTFKIHIEADQLFLGNSLSNHSGFQNINSPQQHNHYHHQHKPQHQQDNDMNMEISHGSLHGQSNSEYVRINSVLNEYYHERLSRGKHVHATSPKKKDWAPQINPNEKGLNL